VVEYVVVPALWAAACLALLWGLYRVRIQQLRRQEKKLRDVIETMPTFAWTLCPTRGGLHQSSLGGIYGFVHGKNDRLRLEAAVHPRDLPRSVERWRASVAFGEPFEHEVRFRRAADGEYRWFLSNVCRCGTREARSQMYGISTDIEDRKRAEESLRSSEAYLVEAQSLTHTGSCAIDGTSHETVYWSDEMFQLFGFDPQQGLPMFDQWLHRIHQRPRKAESGE